MKKEKIDFFTKIVLFLIAILIPGYCLLNIIGIPYLNYVYVAIWIAIAIFSYIEIGYIKSRKILKKDSVQIVIIYTILYLLLTYILGLFTGFQATPVSLKIFTIISNIVPIVLLIVSQEIVRYILISKLKNNKFYLSIVTLLFVANQVVTYYFLYQFSDYSEIFEFLGIAILGTLFNNILYTYVSYHVGNTPNIYYRIIMECYVYLVPFVPNPGVYLRTVFSVILPVIIMLRLSRLYEKEEKALAKRTKYKWAYMILATLPLIVLIGLISGLFKYQIMAIASDSMNPVFKRGDAVIINKDTSEKFELNQIVAFKSGNRVVVHRIVKIEKKDNKLYYTTKGDNNNVEDQVKIEASDVIGIVEYTIPIVGFPTIWLNEMFE